MFLTCPSVRPSVHLLLILCIRYSGKKWTDFDTNCQKWSMKGMKGLFWGQKVKDRGVMPWWCVSLDSRHQLALRGEEERNLTWGFLPLLEVRTSYLLVVPPPRATTVRYSICRLNAGSGGEDPDEPPDCLYGLQVRGPPFSLGGSLFWVLSGSGGSALLFADFSVLASILLRSLSMSGTALSTRLMGALRLRGSCSWLGERKRFIMVGVTPPTAKSWLSVVRCVCENRVYTL